MNIKLNAASTDLLRNMTDLEFLGLGVNKIAYIREEKTLEGKAVFVLHAADGTELTSQQNPEILAMLATQNDLATLRLQ